ncbi:hypothetical protein PROVALCAL_03035 [Providencia alcalifaciens DSM 30120]|uniref:Uncharacterized protein n=1 Tax=Providencia alcalifaciens DSM 30120 TaxID=520999 RepID=B6XI47_9GAMM|nr:hypothetical protein PROVALCAL_03035 [Providencia alcalifaciens DSM 30120]
MRILQLSDFLFEKSSLATISAIYRIEQSVGFLFFQVYCTA